jgi:hypothetical protein
MDAQPDVLELIRLLEQRIESLDGIVADACAELIVLASSVLADLELLRLYAGQQAAVPAG